MAAPDTSPLARFRAFKVSGGVRLLWIPADYADIFDYRVMRSTDTAGAGGSTIYDSIGDPPVHTGNGAGVPFGELDIITGTAYLDPDGTVFDIYRVIPRLDALNEYLPSKAIFAKDNVDAICLVTGTLENVEGEPLQNAEVKFRLEQLPAISGELIGVQNTQDTVVRTNANGYFQFDAIRNSFVSVEINQMRFFQTVQIPNQATVELFTLSEIQEIVPVTVVVEAPEDVDTILPTTTEFFTITAPDVAAGFVTLANTPFSATGVSVAVVGGPQQINAANNPGAVMADFEVSGNKIIFNANGSPSETLSEIIALDDVIFVEYEFEMIP